MLSRQARRFIDNYPQTQLELQKMAGIASIVVQRIIEPLNLDIHLVGSRVKSPQSVLAKLRRKRYGAPSRQLTDQIGIRVITFFQDDVDRVANALREALEIDARRSIDKRQQLGVQQFGYRSVHLIARFGRKIKQTEATPYATRWFEIQIRSILEHAWAEIEHETNYKAGIRFPQTVLRRFGAVAGSLEILEGEFLLLRRESNVLIEQYKSLYERLEDGEKELDAARLLGLLEARRSRGLSWRQAAIQGKPFSPRIEAVCVEALGAAEIKTGKQLDGILRGRRFLNAVEKFASANGLAPVEISHFAAVVIAIGIANKNLLKAEYPELLEDPALRMIFND